MRSVDVRWRGAYWPAIEGCNVDEPDLYGQSPGVPSVEGAQSLRMLRHSDNFSSKMEVRSSADE